MVAAACASAIGCGACGEPEHYVAIPWGDAGAPADASTPPPACLNWDPCWVQMPWSDCVQRVEHPEAVQPPLVWEPCPWPSSGCVRQEHNWEGFTSGVAQVAMTAAGVRVGVQQLWGPVTGPCQERGVLFDGDGAPVEVWRVTADAGKKGCTIDAPVLASERVWLEGGNVLGTMNIVLGMPYADIATATVASSYHGMTEALHQASNDVYAGRWGGAIVFIERETDTYHPFGGPNVGSYGQPRFVGDDTALVQCLYELNRPKACVWTTAQPGVMTKLVDPPGQVVAAAASDGQTLVWIQNPAIDQPDGTYAPGDIWTSPFTTNPAEVVPTKRRPAPPNGWDVQTVAGSGYFAASTNDLKVHIYRLSDMQHWSFDWPGHVVTHLIYIDEAELWYMTDTQAPDGGLVRQRIDALGPGD